MFLPLLLFAAAAAAQNLIADPSFESSTALEPSWNCSGRTGVDTNSGSDGNWACTGSNNAYIFGGGLISQRTTAVAGMTYRLSFDSYALDEDLQGQPNLQVSFQPEGAPVWDTGNTSASAYYLTIPNGTNIGPYESTSFDVVAQGNDILSFGYASASVSTDPSAWPPVLRIDDVSLTPLGPAPYLTRRQPVNTGLVAASAVLGATAIAACVWAGIVTRKLSFAQGQLDEWGFQPRLMEEAMMTAQVKPYVPTPRPPASVRSFSLPALHYSNPEPVQSPTADRLVPEIMQEDTGAERDGWCRSDSRGGERGHWNKQESGDTYNSYSNSVCS